jgi:hypothetical protein
VNCSIGSSTALIASFTIYEGFVVVERGEIGSTELGEFKLDKYISRRPKVLRFQQLLKKFMGTAIRDKLRKYYSSIKSVE